MAGLGIGLGIGAGGASGGGAALKADKSAYLASVSAGALIATLADPYGSGSTFSVVGSAPATLALASGGRIVAGAGAQTSGQVSTIVIRAVKGARAVEEPLMFTAQAATPTPAPTPTALLLGSRFNQPGFNGYTGSDGTDTDSNFRMSSFNETGAAVTKLRAYFVNWMANATNEQDGYTPITVTAAVEYPEGAYTQLKFGGATSTVLAINGATSLAETDEATLATAIPAGAQYWVRTYVSGGRWVQGYLRSTSAGEAVDFSTGVDKTMAGGVFASATATASRRGYGPIAVTATAITGTPVAKAFAAIGDSIIMGSSDAADPLATGHGNIGYFAKACSGFYPVLNLGIAGTKAYQNVPASFTRRGALLAKLGAAITHIFCDWSVNDIDAGRAGTTLANNVATVAAGFKSYIPSVKVVWSTLTPYTNSTDSWKTTANQTPRNAPTGAFTGGASSQRSVFNAALRAGISGVDIVFDAADVAETARDSGIWRAGEGSTHLTNSGATSDAFTSDGLHPTAFNTAGNGLGGIYVLRDAVRAVFSGW